MFAALHAALPSPVALRRLLLLLALVSPSAWACSVVNSDHCANLDGDATCKQRDLDRPYCSQCLGDNNGCFADIPDDTCHAVTVAQPASSSSSSSFTTTTGPTTTPDDPTTSASDGDTTTSSTSSGSSSTTADPSTSSTSSSTDATTSTTTTGDTTTSTTDPSSTSTGSSDDTGTDSSSSTGDGPPVCGDAKIEGDEVCDGNKLDGQTCTKLLPSKWGGGTLKCTNTCKSFDDTACCIGVGQPCNYLLQPDELCCGGLGCPLSGKCTVK